MGKRARKFTSAAAIAAAAATPIGAQAEDAAKGLTFSGRAVIEQAVDDNIYGTANHRISDYITRILPRLEAKLDTGAVTARMLASAEYGRYATHHSEDYLDATLAADAALRLSPGASIFGGLEHAWEHEDRDSLDAANGDSPTEYRRLRGWAGAEADLGPATAKLAVNVAAYDFQDVSAGAGVIDMDFRDRTMIEAGLRLTRPLDATRKVFVQGAWDSRAYDRAGSVDRDSDGFNAAIGVSGALGSLTGEALIGAMVQDYADPALKDVATFDIGAALTWAPEPLTRVRFALDRSIEETTVARNGVPASSYTATTLTARASQRVAPQITLGIDAGWQMAAFNGIDRTDHLSFFGVDARYYLSPKVWFGAEMRHVERNSNVGGADYAANVAMLRLGVQSEDEYGPDAPLATGGAGEIYGGLQIGHGALVSTLDGVRGNGGSNAGSFGDDGAVGGGFIGWRRQINRAVFGLEAEAEVADTDWSHGADRSFSVKRGPGYGLSAIAGYRLPGGALAYLRGGVVNADFDTHYDESGQSFDESANAFGLRAGFGLEAPLTGRLSARVEYVLTAWGDHDASVSAESDNFADAEGMARLGLVWRFGADGPAADPVPVDFSGFYAGALVGHGALMSRNTGDRTGFTLDAERAGFGVGLGVAAGYGMMLGDVYLGAEVDAEISSANWTQERAPSGRVYAVEKTGTVGAALRVGYVVNDSVLLYARGGPVMSRFDTDFATSGSSAKSSEDKVGLRFGAGVEVGVTETMRLRVEYTQTSYDTFGISYGGGNRDEFDSSETQFRAGVLFKF